MKKIIIPIVFASLLVLAGGGARGSYQVGVLRALMELDWHPQIITGTDLKL